MQHIILIHPPAMPLTLFFPVRARKRARAICKGQHGGKSVGGMAAGFGWFMGVGTLSVSLFARQVSLPKNSRFFFALCPCISFEKTVDYLGVRPKSTRMRLTNMKTTFLTALFAAAAIVGSQASAYYQVFTLSEMNDDDRIDTDGEVLVNIDAQRTLKFIDTNSAHNLTLDFQESSILKAYFMINMPYNGFLNITSTEDAVKTAWKTAFSVEGGDSITLCTAGEYIWYKHGPLQLFGRDAGLTVSLDGTEVVYKGAVDGLEILQQNEVGIVWGEKDIKLVGKIGAEPGPTPPVPEPATGSLSLLALAGLCARRRRK